MDLRLYLVDFDRTLFDTAKFQDHIAKIISPGDPSAFTGTISDFTNADTGYYSVFEHASQLTGLSRDELIALLADKLPEEDYLFGDVAPWIKQLPKSARVAVLTVGGPDYQGLKFKRAPALDGIPKHLINEAKGNLLATELAGHKPPYKLSFLPGSFREIWLIDDHPAHLTGLTDLLGVTPVRIVRPGGKYSPLPTPPGVKLVITSFGELP